MCIFKFGSNCFDIKDMIHRRLKGKNWSEKSWTEEEVFWPEEFCLSK